MATEATLKSIDKSATVYHIEFADGSGFDFPSFDEMKTWALSAESQDIVKQLLMAWWIARNADGTNENLVVGKKMIFDLTAPQMIKVQ